MTTTPRIIHIKDLREMFKTLNSSFESLQEVEQCEDCDLLFPVTEEEVKLHQFKCPDCRTHKCDECSEELEDHEEGMCQDCEFNFHL